MVYHQAITEQRPRYAESPVRKIGTPDLVDALAKGVADFNEKPCHLVVLTLVYPLVALLSARLIFGYDVLPLLFPLAAGFALVGPVAAIGLYEISRRREQGLDVAWHHAFGVLRSPALGSIVELTLILTTIFLFWLVTAYGLYVALFGHEPPASLRALVDQICCTPEGWILIVVGNAAGFLFALVVLTISIVSFPLLLDRNVSTSTAMATSVLVVLTNPRATLLWGLIVTVGLVLGSIPFFVGLCVVLPVLGHATWHLYRKAVAW